MVFRLLGFNLLDDKRKAIRARRKAKRAGVVHSFDGHLPGLEELTYADTKHLQCPVLCMARRVPVLILQVSLNYGSSRLREDHIYTLRTALLG